MRRERSGRSPLRIIAGFVLQSRCVILTTMEHTDDGNLLSVHIEGNHGAPFVMGDTQAGAHIIALDAAMRESAKAFSITDDRLGIARSDIG